MVAKKRKKSNPKNKKNSIKQSLKKKLSVKLKKVEKKILGIKEITKPKKIEKVESYLSIEIPSFKELFDKGNGIPIGASVLIEGGPGSGKTIFCLAAVNALCKQGKKCLYMSFEEPEDRLITHMKNFNYSADKFLNNGLLRIKRFDAIDVSRSVEALLSAAKKELLIEIDPVLFPSDFQPDFVVIDSLTSIASAFSGQGNRFRIYMEQLFRYLEKRKMTNFLIREVASPAHLGTTFKEEGEAVSFLSDGIIVLYSIIYDSGERKSAIEILKMRGSGFKRKIVEMKILSKKGIFIYPEKVIKKEFHGEGFNFT